MADPAAGADDVDPAAGSDSSFVTHSTVRSGHKREFDFALRAHAKIPSTLGRTRRTSLPATATPIPPRDAVTKRPRGDRDYPIAAAPPLQLNPAKPGSPAPVKLETLLEQVKLMAQTPSPSKHKASEPTLQSNLKTPVNMQELKLSNHKLSAPPVKLKTPSPSPSPAGALEPGLKQSNHKPPAPPLELTPAKLNARAGVLEPGPAKLKVPIPNGELETEQVKMKSPGDHLGPVKLEMALKRELVKPVVAGSVQEVGEYFPWELSPGRAKTPTPTDVEGKDADADGCGGVLCHRAARGDDTKVHCLPGEERWTQGRGKRQLYTVSLCLL